MSEATVQPVNWKMPYKVIENFMSKNECRAIIDFCTPLMKVAASPTPEQKQVADTSVCNNHFVHIRHLDSPRTELATSDVASKIIDRIAKYLNIPLNYHEPVQILKYDKGGYYRNHLDNSYEDNPRKITFQIYLNDVEEGGETHFSRQLIEGEDGNMYTLAFLPKRGRAIVWENYPKDSIETDGRKKAHMDALHEGIIIGKGKKFGWTSWIKERPLYSLEDPLKPVSRTGRVIQMKRI